MKFTKIMKIKEGQLIAKKVSVVTEAVIKFLTG